MLTSNAIWQLNLLPTKSFIFKLTSLLFLIPLFAGVIIGKLHSPKKPEEKTGLSFNFSLIITLFAIVLLLVRYTEQLTGFPLSSLNVYHDNRITGYLLQYFNFNPILALLILFENISRLNKRFTVKLCLLPFLQNIILALVDQHYFLIVAVVTIINFLISQKKRYTLNWIVISVLIGAAIFSCIYLCPAPTYNYASIALILFNAIVIITYAFIKQSLKYFSIALFLLVGGLVAPHSLLSNFNALIFGFTLFVFLYEDKNQPLSEHAKHLIVKSEPTLQEKIFYSNPSKVTLSSHTLSELISSSLIGSNNKKVMIKDVFNELEFGNSDLNFDLSMVRALLSDVQGDKELATEWFEKASSKARGNVEKYVAASFIDSDDLYDIKEDLDYEDTIDATEALTKFKAIREKLQKLQP